jgi:2-(1,2-epoxy-1,2-dihydrophenyl)acetyl-CoA isomerase
MSFEMIELRIENGVAWATLNRPDKLNSINSKMLEELNAVLDQVEDDEAIRCLVLTGAGRGFCAGQDLNDRNMTSESERPDLGKTVGEGYNPFLRRLYNLEVPTIAAVNGTAAGAGANIALACDIVIASEAAKFIQVYSNIGLIPDASGTFMLPRLIGMARAMALAFTAQPVMAKEAQDMGMIWKAIPAEEHISYVTELAENFAQKPTLGMAYTKKAFHASFSNDLDTQLDLERDYMQKCGYSHDYSEGVKAFLEKRKPEFKGK